jgi:hypothetical protein
MNLHLIIFFGRNVKLLSFEERKVQNFTKKKKEKFKIIEKEIIVVRVGRCGGSKLVVL